ncbi:MAG: aldehyde-activating protein [Alphaproteobacteria bacterium]|nr:aldehyde-activating protein [Alphaproteobacteria bacterium]
MSKMVEGGCRCGRVRYRIAAGKLPNVYACHCRDCQTWSGSAFSLQFIVPEGALMVEGDPSLFELTSADGERVSRQRACPICFTRVYNTNTARPGLAVVRAGTLDRSDELAIVAHIWTKRKLAGIDIPANVPSWPEGAPPADFIVALTRE